MIHQVVAAALLFAQAPAAAPPVCVTHEEAADMAVALMPYLLDAAAQRCGPHLAPGAFLTEGVAAWRERLLLAGEPRRASAMRGVAKFMGASAPEGAGAEATFDFVAQLFTVGFASAIEPQSCAHVDTLARALEPLPPENIALLVRAGLGLAEANRNEDEPDGEEAGEAEADEEESSGPPLCPA